MPKTTINDLLGSNEQGSLQGDSVLQGEQGEGLVDEGMQGVEENGLEPGEQESYERVVLGGIQALHGEKTKADVMKTLKQGAETPAKTMSSLAMMIFGRLDDEADGKIPVGVIAHSIDGILIEIAELASKSGAFVVDDAIFGRARQLMVVAMAEEFQVDEAEIQEFMATFKPEELEQMRAEQEAYNPGAEQEPFAEEAGTINQMMPV